MARTIEKRFLLAAGVWNIITSIITIFGYSSWFKNEGIQSFQTNEQLSYMNTSLLDSLVSIILVFGLLIFAMGVVNIYLSRRLDKVTTFWKMNTWLFSCIVIHFFCFDVIGVLLYLATTVFYLARNKVLKSNRQVLKEGF